MLQNFETKDSNIRVLVEGIPDIPEEHYKVFSQCLIGVVHLIIGALGNGDILLLIQCLRSVAQHLSEEEEY